MERTTPAPAYVTHIRPRRGISLGEILQRRELLELLVWRDLKVRYKQTVIGAAWAVIQPAALMVIFTLFFGELAGVPSDGAPYPVFAYVALLPWTYFANAVTAATSSLVANQSMVAKVYFPRVFLPASPILAGLVDLAIACGVLLLLLLWYGIEPTLRLVTLPIFVSLAVLTAMGAGLWLSALNAAYRDIRYAVPFLIQLWLFASPVVYGASAVPERFRWLYALNPMVGVIEGFRWAALGRTEAPVISLAVGTLVSSVLLVTGFAYFRRVEGRIVDVI